MTENYYVLYCEFADAYIWEERRDVWQFTGSDTALRFPDFPSARRIKVQLEKQGFPELTIHKVKQVSTIIRKRRNKRWIRRQKR